MLFWPTRRPIKKHFNCARHFLTLPNCFRCLQFSPPLSLSLAQKKYNKANANKNNKTATHQSCHAQKAIKNWRRRHANKLTIVMPKATLGKGGSPPVRVTLPCSTFNQRWMRSYLPPPPTQHAAAAVCRSKPFQVFALIHNEIRGRIMRWSFYLPTRCMCVCVCECVYVLFISHLFIFHFNVWHIISAQFIVIMT